MPDWDDRVDPGYDFATDRFSLVRDAYHDDLYAHEVLDDPYDGLLVSLPALPRGGPKKDQVARYGMRAYLRLPPGLGLLGDCGAFSYVRQAKPAFETADAVEQYEQLGFDYGVSVDHLIVPEFHDQRDCRYELTLRNAEEFLRIHRTGDYHFVPIGAVQGWDEASYVEAALAVAATGYDYIALGGLARSNTHAVRGVVSAVAGALPKGIRIHVFGVARLTLLPLFLELGIESVDSAAPLRQAWLSARDNYYTLDRTYAALRIPIAEEERPKPQTLVGRSDASLATLTNAEREALAAVRAYDRRELKLQPTLDALIAYDKLLATRLDDKNTAGRYELYRQTLRDRPWKHCPCPICRELGVEVIIFRGNNRNRRRGFHNAWVVKRRVAMLSRELLAVSA